MPIFNAGGSLPVGLNASMPYIAGGPIPVYITGSDLIPASYPEVLNYDALPPAADHNTEMYVCLTAKGVYFFGRKP